MKKILSILASAVVLAMPMAVTTVAQAAAHVGAPMAAASAPKAMPADKAMPAVKATPSAKARAHRAKHRAHRAKHRAKVKAKAAAAK